MSKTVKPADWKKWGRTSVWSHLEAACLSVGLEPVSPDSAAAEITRSKQSPGPKSNLHHARQRYHFIRFCFQKDAPIDRIEFVQWAVQSGYVNLPDEMVEMLGDDLHLPYFSIKQVANAVADQEEWHDDARKVLLDQMQRGAGNDSLLPCSGANYRLDDDPGSWHLVDPADASKWLLASRRIVWPARVPLAAATSVAASAAIESDVEAQPQSATTPSWTLLAKPKRLGRYRNPLYEFLKAAHAAGQPCPPRARDVLAAWEKECPRDIEIMSDGIKYDGPRSRLEANLKAIQQAIKLLTDEGEQARQKTRSFRRASAGSAGQAPDWPGNMDRYLPNN